MYVSLCRNQLKMTSVHPTYIVASLRHLRVPLKQMQMLQKLRRKINTITRGLIEHTSLVEARHEVLKASFHLFYLSTRAK